MSIQHGKTQSQQARERRQKFQKGGFEKTKTMQADKDRCCVNNIMAKYHKTGIIDHVRQTEGRYADVSDVGDFQEAMNIVAQGKQSFEALPAKIRKRFNNDPVEFLQFVGNPDNQDDLIKMGLATARPTPEPAPEPEKTAPEPEKKEALAS